MFSLWLALRRQESARFRQYHHRVRTMRGGPREGGFARAGGGGEDGGEFARLVYVDDKQGCTNVSGNSTNRNG